MKEFDKITTGYGAVVAIMTAIFGQYWFLFAGFLLLNVVDYTTGLCKARILKTESSAVGAVGILKKVMYWVVIGLAFFVANCFTEMGELIGINLSFVVLFGWFTLATYIINEIRSILENLIELDVKVPAFLIKGLQITQGLIDKSTSREEGELDE